MGSNHGQRIIQRCEGLKISNKKRKRAVSKMRKT
nr:MAG TPA: hypothetical protein [Caudoviricetes sp.]